LPESVQTQLDAGRNGLRIGLLSASTSRVRHDPFRAISFADLVPLFEATRGRGLRFYDLNQAQAREADVRAQAEYGIADIGPALNTFGQTAAVLRQLDLLISVDTGPAHLAGALGRPTWLLLSAACDCRWLDNVRTTPWYDSMRLYRQSVLGDWTAPVQAMIAGLPRTP
jgi:ADP-heptose:LPS heptosyltransferase